MSSSTPFIRLGLFALTAAIILSAATLHSRNELDAIESVTTRPVVTLGTISVRPSEEDLIAATALRQPLQVLPTVEVRASEEEVIAARIDPTDRIQIMSTISIRPSADEIAAAMLPVTANASASVDEDGGDMIGAVLTNAVAQHHRLRLDMPYYSFGKVLTSTHK
jgi:hypothetical protein